MEGSGCEPRFSKNFWQDLRCWEVPTVMGFWRILIGLWFFACTVPTLAAQSESAVVNPLTTQERAWLKAHPIIRLAYPPGHEPTLMEDEDGTLLGVLADYYGLINSRLGTNLKPTLIPWLEVDDKIRNREIEGLVAATPKKVEALGLLPTQKMFSSYVVVYGKSGNDSLNFPDDLYGRRVTVLSGFNHTDLAVDQIRDKAEIIAVKSPRAGLEAVHRNRADFFIGAISNNYLVSKYQLFGIGALHVFWDQPYRVGPAVRADLPVLASILEKGANLITDEEFDTMVARWTRLRRTEIQVELTPDERIWLDQHPNIELGYTDVFEPGIIVNEDGSYSGTLVDILELLNQRLGTDFSPTAKSIPELIRQVNDKELAGVLSIHSDRADKLGWLRTKSYMNSYPTIFTRKGFTFTGPSDLAGKKIALVDRVFFSRNLVDLYGAGSQLIKVKDGREGLETVRSGKADLYVGSSRNSYLLSKYQFYDLTASFQFYDHPTPNVMAVRNDWPQLVSILNKGMESISAEEIESILQKWGSGSIKQQAVYLTPEEQSWLKENPRIGVGVSPIPPYMFSENGRAKGYLIDMMELLVNQVGLAANYSIKTIDENLSDVKSGEIHTILGMIHNEERAGFMYLSENVMNMQMSIFAGTSRSDISDAASLKDKVMASFKGYGFEPVIKKFFPDATIIQADDTAGMLRLVASGEADAAVQELHSGEYILRDNFINGVSRKGSFAPTGLPLMTGSEFGVSKKYPLLNSILNKAYDTLPESEKTRVWRKWFASDTEQKKTIKLTSEEQAWLAENHTARVRASDWPPYMIIKENESPQGIAVEYLKLIEERTGVNFEYDVTDQPFGEFLESMKQNQGPDLTALIVKNPEREQYLSFTDPYISSPYVIFAREREELLLDISGLSGRTLAVPRGFVMQQLLERDYPEIKLKLFDNDEQALFALSSGKVDSYIGNLTVSSHIIQRHGFSNIRVVASTPYGEQILSLGIRNDWPELISILNKALTSITEEEKTSIRNKYIAVRYEQGVDRADVMRWILIVVGGAFGIVIIFVFWNRSLAKRVRQRTLELERTADSLKTEIEERNRTETALEISRRFTDNLVETANVMIVGLDAAGTVTIFNPAAERISGYTVSELHGKNWFELLVPRDRYPSVYDEYNRLMQGGLPHIFENPIVTKDGRERFISWSNNEIKENDQIAGILSFGIDITARRQAEKDLQRYQQRLKAMASQLTIAEEKERRKIAADLHDHVGHSMALARMQLNGILDSSSDLERKILVNDISNIMLQALQDTRSLIFELSSPSMNELGLGAAISEWLEEQIEKRHGLKIEFSDNLTDELRKTLDQNMRALLFRNVRELLANVVKHAQAKKVVVRIREEINGVIIVIQDDGLGFDPDALKTKNLTDGGFGLFSIQERMTDLGGSFDIQAKPGQGCRVVLTVPVEEMDRTPKG